MMLMGDEYGHTRYGNNNSYGHDSAINNFQWGQVRSTFCFVFFIVLSISTIDSQIVVLQLEKQKESHFRFFSEVIRFRQTHHLFGREDFLGKVIHFTCFYSVIVY